MQTEMGAAQRVLSTASRLFYANGVRAVGIEWIVAEAGDFELPHRKCNLRNGL
jgi:hypothetical protein